MTRLAVYRSSLLACFAAIAFLPAFSQSVVVTPITVSFGNQPQGTSSSAHKVTLKNGQTSAITVTSISTSLSDYGVSNNCPVSPATLVAGATCTISITFTPSVEGSRTAALTVVDTGLSSPQLVTLNGTGTAPSLLSIAVTPATASVAAGYTEQFTATGTYSNGTTANLTNTAIWSSSATAVATVIGTSGLATGVAQGKASITATVGTISGSARLTVTPAVLTSLSVTPITASIIAGQTEQFTATGTYSNGTSQNLTSTAKWSSSSTSVATVKNTGAATAIAQGTATITAAVGTVSGSATLTVTSNVLLSISVTPATATIPSGNTLQFTATGTYSNGSKLTLTSSAQWTSSATSVANVSSGGLATGEAQGTATITATVGAISGSATLKVKPVILTSISVTPATISVAAGYTQQFTATGTYSNGTTENLTSTATWTSSATSIATVNSGGLATTLVQGTAIITATSGTISGSATLTVTPAVLTSISISPASASIALGTTEQFTATGTYSDGSTLNLTNTVTWSTADTTIATVGAQGLATSVAVGSTSVAATSGAISGLTTLTVTPAVLVSIAVTPAIPTIPLGTTQQFTATGTYTDGSMQNITDTVQWSSDTATVATISNAAGSQGVASGAGQGTATISASAGTVTGSTILTVTSAALVSLAITPATASLALGTSQQFTATGTFTDGSTQNLTSTANWSSDTLTTATINNAGLASSVGIGTATITATSGSVSSSTVLTVTAAALVSITINPPGATIPLGMTQQFTATGTFSDGTTQDVTQSGQWSSTVATVATISNSAGTAGLATSMGAGTTTISISSAGVSAVVTLVVNPAALVSIAISPQAPTIALGTSQQFTATGTYSDGSTQDVTSLVTWSSSNALVAIISNSIGSYGLATSSGQGSAIITATLASVTSSTTISIASPALVSIAITPQAPTIALGTSQQFTATGTYTDGSSQDVTASVTWASDTPAVAPVSAGGLVTGAALGTANISATSGTVTNSTSVSVSATLVLLSISISPASASIVVGTTQQFTATGTYSDGSTQNLTSTVNWTSSLTSVALIGSSGSATGVGIGTATITATSGSVAGSATLTVGLPVLVSIAVTPSNPSLALGTTQQFTATGTYSDGSTLNLTNAVTWSTADSTIAMVSAQGLATSVAVGSTSVAATSGAISGLTTLTVTPAVLVSIAVTPAIPTIPLGTTQQFTATGTYTDSSTQNITDTVQWSSDTATVATISNAAGSQGVASSIGQGTATISASAGTVTGSTILTVTSAALVSLAITPATASLALGTSQQFMATGTFTDGSTQNLTSTANWSSDTLTTATINNAGLASSVGIGTATITGTSGSISSSTVLTVTAAALVSITINPPGATIPLGMTQQFTATGTFSDGTTQDVTQSGQWSSTVATVATISNSAGTAGLATSVGAGTTTIGISSAGVSAVVTLVVNPAALVSIAISPQAPTIALGTSQQFTATGTYSDGSTQDVTSLVTWSSSNALVAIISNSIGSYGLATSSGQGSAIITATLASVTSSTTITIASPALVSIAISPSNASVPLGSTLQFTATGTYTDGSTQNLTSTATWTSSPTSIASISSGGLATGLAQGSVTITAASGTISGSATLTVTAATLISISVTPGKESLAAGHTHQYTATGTYSNGTTQNLTTEVTWTSSAPSVATVRSTTGLVTGVAAGTTTITAESGTISGSASLTVTETLTSISVTPTTASVAAGYTEEFTATGTFSNGTTQNLTSTATWTSSAMSIAIVSGGLATSLAQGTVTITATSGIISGSAPLTVTAPVLTSISVTPTATSVPVGNLQQFTATGLYSNGTTQNLTSTLTWVSSAPSLATIASSGLATGVAQGTSRITANSGSLSGSATLTITTATGSISSFQHVIVIVQENRTPDNLFQGLCSAPYGSSTSCSSIPSGSQYDIQTGNWLDKTSSTNTTQPVTVALANAYDLNHDHAAFTAMCDVDATGVCLMDSAADVSCSGTCPTRPQFAYVDNSTGLLDPYLTIATQYGWSNYMFQTNQGPSFPAHQFLFGGTSAPSAADDAAAIFAAENMAPREASAGCTALEGTTVTLVGPAGENPTLYPAIYPCFERQTMADLFDSNGISWKYYTPAAGSIWTAPNAIQHLCVPNAPTGGECTGSDWTNDVVLNPAQVLSDIGNCNLDQVSWVIPSGQNSDHANGNSGGGPSWVASIVNAIGNNHQCKDGEVYWNNTAILITWDDWGGWYDHEPPTFLGAPQGDYQYGFRVPLLVVSAYTPAAYVDNNRMDFGTILRFLEHNFSIEEGSLNFADARTQIDLTEFFNLNQAPRPFQIVPAPLDANYFLNDKTPPTDPDDD